LIEGTMLRNFGARRVGLHTTWSAPQAKNPSYAPVHPMSLQHYSVSRVMKLLMSFCEQSLVSQRIAIKLWRTWASDFKPTYSSQVAFNKPCQSRKFYQKNSAKYGDNIMQ